MCALADNNMALSPARVHGPKKPRRCWLIYFAMFQIRILASRTSTGITWPAIGMLCCVKLAVADVEVLESRIAFESFPGTVAAEHRDYRRRLYGFLIGLMTCCLWDIYIRGFPGGGVRIGPDGSVIGRRAVTCLVGNFRSPSLGQQRTTCAPRKLCSPAAIALHPSHRR